MAKKKAFSGIENEKGSTTSINSKAQINKLLHNASMMSKNRLLKHGLNISELENILNGHRENSEDTDHTESESELKQSIKGLTKQEIKKKTKKIRREKVSSSAESSEEQELHKPNAIKEERLSITEESESSDDLKVPVIIRTNVSSHKDDKKIKKSKSASSLLQSVKFADSNSENEGSLQSKDRFHKGNRMNKSLSPKNASTSLSFNSRDNISSSFMGKKNKKERTSRDKLSDSEHDASNSQADLFQHEETMEDIENMKEKTKNPEKLSSFKNKVNVLQNICLTPPKNNSLKERLAGNLPGIKQIKTNMSLEFSNTEDIYLFRVPKNVEPSSLQNIQFNLEEKCKINIGKKYDIGPTHNVPLPTLAVSDNCKILHFRGSIEMEKHIKLKKDPNIVIPETKSVPLPDNLKKRHPLFGSDYKQKIKLSEHVKQKVDDAIEILLKKAKRTKKKKHENVKLKDMEENKNETIFMLLNDHSHQNTKNVKQELLDYNASSSRSTEKLNNLSSYTHSVNETLKRIKSEILTEAESDYPESMSPKKKKKSKERNSLLEQTLPEASIKNHANIKTEPSHFLSNYEDKLNSTLITDESKTPSFSPEVSRITLDGSNSERTPKKRRKKSEADEESSIIETQLISNILDKLKSDLSPKKVKKKKVRQSE